MENEISNQIGLTSSDNSLTLKGGDLFMDNNNAETGGSQPPPEQEVPETTAQEKQTPPDQPQSPDSGARAANAQAAPRSIRGLLDYIGSNFTDLQDQFLREGKKIPATPEDAIAAYVEQGLTKDQAIERLAKQIGFGSGRQGADAAMKATVQGLFIENPELGEELAKADPDGRNLDALARFIDEKLNISDPQTAAFAKEMTRPDLVIPVVDETTGEVVVDETTGEVVGKSLSADARRLVLEWTLEKIIGLPEKKSPDSDYNIGSWYAQSNIDELSSLSESNFSAEEKKLPANRKFIRYIGELIEMRKVAHELRRSLSLGDSYKNIIQEHLKTHGLDFLYNEMAGVDKALALYETLLGVKASEKRVWLEQRDITEVDKQVRRIMETAQRQGLLKKHDKSLSPRELELRWLESGQGDRALTAEERAELNTYHFERDLSPRELELRLKDSRENELTQDEKKELEDFHHDRVLTSWEVERALSMGKILTMGLQRQAIYTSLGKMPGSVAARLSSMPNEFMGRAIAPLKAYAERFFAGGADASYGGPRAFMRRLVKEIVATQNVQTLFGVETNSWNLNGWGSVDALSSKWRNELQFLANIEIDFGSGQTTLTEFLDGRMSAMMQDKKFSREIDFDQTHGYSMSKETNKDVKTKLGRDKNMLAAIVGQRLYLSVLLRYDYLPEIAKQALFKKIAILDPLKMAAFRPDVLDGLTPVQRELWDQMRDRLILTNMARVEEDAKAYFSDTNQGLYRKTQKEDRLRAEAEKLINFDAAGGPKLRENINEDVRYEIMNKYFPELQEDNNSTPEERAERAIRKAERAVLRKVIDAGVETRRDSSNIVTSVVDTSLEHGFKKGLGEILRRGSVKTFIAKGGDMSQDVSISTMAANAHMPFTFILNDVPHVSWAKPEDGPSGVADEDMIRLFIFDGGGYQKAYEEALKPLIEQPNQEFRKRMKDFVDNIKNPDGEYKAQGKAEVIIQAWMRMASEYRLSGGISELIRTYDVPRSEMEKYYPKSHLALNAAERGIMYDALAQDNTLSDARTRLFLGLIELRKSQLKRLKEATNSSRGKVMRDALGGFIRLLAGVLGIGFLSAIFSKETLKEAGLTA
jgi:hypothetical protein